MCGFTQLKQQLLTYLSEEKVAQLEEAYRVAALAHEGQHRSTGEPYISHPIEVAHILAKMHMDHQSIIAAMLHDVIEDTAVDKSFIADKFGEEVAEIVDGVSKLALIKFESRAEAQAENLRKMILAMARDIRVILVKLADRLHNMRTLHATPLDKQQRVAKETLEIYAPIANRLGMHNFRMEFEDLAFSYIYPIRYKIIKEAVKKARGNRKAIIHDMEATLAHRLTQEKMQAFKIFGREKHLYSLYQKMRKKALSLTEVMDVYALRLIVDSVDSCYRALGIVHNLFKPVHGRFKDYIAVPKINGYQSLHTIAIGNHGLPIEIQIRTKAMDQLAENGIAAHWLYKGNIGQMNEAEIRARQWLRGILEIQETTGNSLEFIEHVKIDLYPDEVYVFTPSGDILSLSAGSTCVDFAYAVHTVVGNTCIAAKIDRRLVPLNTRLKSGQTVEIVTARGAHPNPAWLNFVVTGKARNNIRNWLKNQKSTESRELGKRLLERSLAVLSLTTEVLNLSHVKKILAELRLTTMDALYEEIGLGNQVAPIVARRLGIELTSQETQVFDTPLFIKGTEGMVVTYGKCCYPIPGDSILGFLSAGRGIVVHRETCHNVNAVKKIPEKYIFIQWDDDVLGDFQVELNVESLNQRGMVASLANALSEYDANIENIHVNERNSQNFTITFLVRIKSRLHLARIIRRLRNIPAVLRVLRTKQ